MRRGGHAGRLRGALVAGALAALVGFAAPARARAQQASGEPARGAPAPEPRAEATEGSEPAEAPAETPAEGPRATDAGPRRVEVASNRPDTRVLLDGVFVGYAPYAAALGSGRHALRLERDGFRAWEGALPAGEAGLVRVRAWLRRSAQAERVRAWGLAGGALGAAALGGALGGFALLDRAGLDDAIARGRLDDRDERVVRATALAVSANVLFSAALGLAIGALYHAAREPGPGSTARVRSPEGQRAREGRDEEPGP